MDKYVIIQTFTSANNQEQLVANLQQTFPQLSIIMIIEVVIMYEKLINKIYKDFSDNFKETLDKSVKELL